MLAWWVSCRKDLKRRLRDPAALALWIGIPAAILILMTLAFGGANEDGGGMPRAKMYVIDRDGSIVSQILVGAFSQGQLAEMIEAVAVPDLDQARQRLMEGDGSAALVIPSGFGEAVMRQQETRLELVTNPAQRILPAILEETMSIAVDGLFYIQVLFGDSLLEMVDAGDPLQTFPTVYKTAERVMEQIESPLIELVQVAPPQQDDAPQQGSFGRLFFPGIFFMAIFFIAQGMSDDIWIEKRYGTLDRALRVPGGDAALLGGKILAGGVLLAAIALIALIAGAMIFDIPWSALPLAIFWSTLSGICLLSLFLLLQVWCSTQRAASLFGHLLIFPLIILGGSLFPTESMPAFLASIGRFTPNGWALARLKEIFDGSFELGQLLPATAVLLAMTAVLFLLAKRRMRSGFARSAG